MVPILIVRAKDRGKGMRYLACDPDATTGLLTYTAEKDRAFTFPLEKLPELLDLVRSKQGYAVRLVTSFTECTIGERDRLVMDPTTGRKARVR